MKTKNAKDVVLPKKSRTRSKSRGGIGSAKSAVPRTKVSAIQCLHCGDIIYSCARHDFRSCSCGKCFIDGGFDYVKVCGNPKEIKGMIKYIPATKQQLYDDWNQSNAKLRRFGCIKQPKFVPSLSSSSSAL